MFTGIVEEAGTITQISESADQIRLSVLSRVAGAGVKPGDSIAVNGCCLTAVKFDQGPSGTTIAFDLLRETWKRTNFHIMKPGSLVNLERSMPADGRVHGHFVTGHIDSTGQVRVFEQRAGDWYLQIDTPAEVLRYIAFKGAIAVDGISLTVAEVHPESFAIWIIPHTYLVTALRDRPIGSLVNLEADLLAKYVEKFTASPAGPVP